MADTTDSGLLTAAFSAIMNLYLNPNVSMREQPEKVSVFDHHKTTYSYGRVGNSDTASSSSSSNDRCLIFIKTLHDGIIECDIKKNPSIEEIKTRIHELLGVEPEKQRLVYSGKQLEEGKTLSQYVTTPEPTLHLVARLNDTKPVVLDPASLDPIQNYDFTHINDGDKQHIRGGERYVRPCGFKRFALNISNKYENLHWIGSSNGVGEWPVSYHGTGEHEQKTLAECGYVLTLTSGRQFPFTRGIYTTPDVHLAEKYAKKFTYNNERYLVIFQNRVNPANLKKVQATQPGAGEYWISPNEGDVRPYGICIRKI